MPFAVAVAAAGVERARYGVDLSDSSHAVELAMRLAQGDAPFRDEMNLQVLGAWPAVPFAWAWLHLVGVEGIVLASRVWFVLVTLLVGALSWLALRRAFGWGTSAAALAVALVPTAYNQQVLSYNTTPALMYLLAASAGVGATTRCARCGRPYAVLAGAAAVLGAVSHPVTAPAAAVFLVLLAVLLRRRDRTAPTTTRPHGIRGVARARPGLVQPAVGALSVLLVVGLLWLAVWGPSHVGETLAFTDAYQATRPGRADRLAGWGRQLGEALSGPWVLAAVWSGVLGAVPAMRAARPLLLFGAVLAVWVQAMLGASATTTFTVSSWLSPITGTVVAAVLLPSLVVAAARGPQPLGRLALLGLSPTLVGMPFVAAFTSSGAGWGATGAALAPGLLAAVLGALVWARTRPAKATLAGLLLVCLGSVHALNSFRDARPAELVAPAPDGAFAGLRTTQDRREQIQANQQALARCAAPGDGVLAYIAPAAFLYADVRFDTPIVWMDYFGTTSRYVLDWVERTGREPDCVVAARAYWPGYARHPYTTLPDPLRDWVLARYHVVAQTSQVVVLRRTGEDVTQTTG